MNLLIDNPGRLPGYNSTAESELGPADRYNSTAESELGPADRSSQTFSCNYLFRNRAKRKQIFVTKLQKKIFKHNFKYTIRAMSDSQSLSD